jgi:hypothetical protein
VAETWLCVDRLNPPRNLAIGVSCIAALPIQSARAW